MIARLEGVLLEKCPEGVVLDAHGVGYEVRVPLSTYFELPDEGKVVVLRVHTNVREDAIQLFGFLSDLERALFRLLLGVSSVGPKIALAILSGLPTERLLGALRAGDLAALVAIPGVGKKTAERIALELREKVSSLSPASPSTPRSTTGDSAPAAESALVNLGYPRAHAEKAVRRAREGLPESPPLEVLIRESLRVASGA